MMDGVSMMSLINGNGRVNVRRPNSLFLDDWLNVVMDVMIRMLIFNDWHG